MFNLANNNPVSPFLSWAGGKQHLLSRIAKYLPVDVRKRRYIEPFAGAASMLLAVRPGRGIAADANELLIQCFAHVRDKPDLIADYLRGHLARSSESYYYQVRDQFNRAANSVAQAARFIYLNKTCFNGLYRVNQRGKFNVPYGHKEPPALPTREQLGQAAEVFAAVELIAGSYHKVVDTAKKGDFVYLDPPYPPLNGTSYFTHYTSSRFAWNDQTSLAVAFAKCSDRGCLVMMSNADVPRIRELFADYHMNHLDVTRYITCKTVKHRARELVITNYDPR